MGDTVPIDAPAKKRRGRPPSERRTEDFNRGRARANAARKRTRDLLKVGESRWDRLLRNEILVTDLDDEEIARGRVRDDDGTFAGYSNKVLPKKLEQQMTRELFRRAMSAMREALPSSIKVAHDIMMNGKKDADRLRAVELFQDRTLGRVPQHVAVHTDAAWEDTFEGVVWGDDDAAPTDDD